MFNTSNLMKLLSFLISALLLCVLWSCENEDAIYNVQMRDGNTIRVQNTQRFYASAEEFAASGSFAFPRPFNYKDIEPIDYSVDTISVVYDYNQSFTGAWEVAEFGDWIKDYGLKPNTPYYVGTTMFAKYISLPPEGRELYPYFQGGKYMGYLPGIEGTNYYVTYSNANGCLILTTGLRFVGYDYSRNAINMHITTFPNNNPHELTWYYVISDAWSAW